MTSNIYLELMVVSRSDMAKHELRVTSYELRVTNYDLKV